MKKSMKLTTFALASSILTSSLLGGVVLVKSPSDQQNIPLQNYHIANANSQEPTSKIIGRRGFDESTTDYLDFVSTVSDTIFPNAILNYDLMNKYAHLSDFTTDTYFTNSSSGGYLSPDRTEYTIIVSPSKYLMNGEWIDGIANPHEYVVTFSVFHHITGDSLFAEKTIDPEIISPGNITALLSSFGINKRGDTFDREFLSQLVDITNFEETTVFKFHDIDTSVTGQIEFEIIPSTYCLERKLFNNKITNKIFSFTIKNLHEFETSRVVVRDDFDREKYGINNISDMFGTTIVNKNNLLEVVDLSSFPNSAAFTISNPVIDGNTYTSTLTPSKFYDDNALLVDNTLIENPKTFSISVTGLSNYANKNSSFVLKNNIDYDKYTVYTIERLLGQGKTTNLANLSELFDMNDFTTATKFTIVNASINRVYASYNCQIVADRSYKNGLFVSNVYYYLSVPNLPAGNETTTFEGIKAPDDLNYNVIGLRIYLRQRFNPKDPSTYYATDTADMIKLQKIVNITDLPRSAAVQLRDEVVDVNEGTYTVNLFPTHYFIDGNEIVNSKGSDGKIFPIKVTGLKILPEGGNTKFTPKADVGKYSAYEASRLIELGKAREVFDFVNLAESAIIKYHSATLNASDSTILKGKFITSQYMRDGLVINNNSDELDTKISSYELFGLRTDPNSTTKAKSIDDKYNNKNLLNYLNVGIVSRDLLEEFMELVNFPDNTTFEITKISLWQGDNVFNIEFIPSHYRASSRDIDNSTQKKKYTQLLNLKSFPDSNVEENPNWRLNFSNKYFKQNIIDLLGTTKVNKENLAEVMNLTNFPANATFTIEHYNVDDAGVYRGVLIPSHYNYDGSTIENTTGDKTFDIIVNDLRDNIPNSSVTMKQDFDRTKYKYITDITDLLGTTTVNMANLQEVANLENFPVNTTFTIDEVKLSDSRGEYSEASYTSRLKPNKVYKDGLIVDNSATYFTIHIGNLTGLLNSELEAVGSNVIPSDINIENINDKLRNGIDNNTVNKEVLGKVAHIDGIFPKDTIFTADFDNARIVNNVSYYLRVTADKYFLNGKEVPQSKSFSLSVLGIGVKPPVEEDNTGLIVGLVVGGVALVLIVAGLAIWYKKRYKK